MQIDKVLIAQFDRARGRKDRSQFVREAIVEKLQGLGIPVPQDLIFPPPRAKIVQYVGHNSGSVHQSIAAEKPPKYRSKKKGKKP